jgi:aldose 1-epimerase
MLAKFLGGVMLATLLVAHTTAQTVIVRASNDQGSVAPSADASTGWQVYTIQFRDTTVRVVPAAGCNVYSIDVADTEFLRRPDDLKKLKGVSYGTPILYPMPNRVRGAQFTYDGQTYKFPPNNSGNFIHGLVHSVAWRPSTAHVGDDFAELSCVLPFDERSELFERFPFPHTLTMTVRVAEKRVRWTYVVENIGDCSVPFGLALHPYFNYLGRREQTFLQVRADALMEAEQQLPSGKLVELDGHPLDARQPVSLAGYNADHVFFGVRHDPAAVVDFRGARRKITFVTSDDFTHLVAYTPDRPFFCLENQTCSTDAHNLASEGRNTVAHLLECPPSKKMSGWVEYQFE